MAAQPEIDATEVRLRLIPNRVDAWLRYAEAKNARRSVFAAALAVLTIGAAAAAAAGTSSARSTGAETATAAEPAWAGAPHESFRPMRIDGSVGGVGGPVAFRDEQGLAVMGARLTPLDLSDPDSPVATGPGWQLAGVANELVVRDDVAYVVAHRQLQAVDLTSPGGSCCDVVPVGTGLALGDEYGYSIFNSWDPLFASVAVLDLADPLRPVHAASGPSLPTYDCLSPVVAAGHLYFACYDGINIQTLADPASPRQTALYGLRGAVDMMALGDRLLVAAGPELVALDISDPVRPVESDRLPLGARALDLSAFGDYVAVVLEDAGVRTVDAGGSRPLAVVGTVQAEGARFAALSGSRLLVGAGNQGVMAASVEADGVLEAGGSLPTVLVSAVASSGGFTYAADAISRQIRVYSTSRPGSFDLVGLLEQGIAISDIAVDGGRLGVLLAVNDQQSLFRIYDATDPAAPALRGEVDLGGARFVAIDGNAAVVSGGAGGVQVVDITNPADPVLAAEVGAPGWGAWSAARGGYAYASELSAGLNAIRIADPANSAVVGTLALDAPEALALAGSRLEVIARGPAAAPRDSDTARPLATPPVPTDERLISVDVSDPTNLRIVTSQSVVEGWPWATDLDMVAAWGTQTFVLYDWASGDWWQSIARFQGGAPADRLELPGPRATDLYADGDRLFVANGGAGLIEISAPQGRLVALYEGSLDTGTPDTQGFDYLALPSPAPLQATQTFAAGVTTLSTSAQVGDSAGYFAKHALVGTLDRQAGFGLRFTVQVTEEEHDASDKNGDGVGDRAGFSIIALASDTRGIELAFWEDEIWAQEDGAAEPPPNENTLFTHAEGAPFDTTRGLTEYELWIEGDAYTLASGGAAILSGRVRDYTAFGRFPYVVPNFVFLGDDTTSASATIRLSEVWLEDGSVEPPSPTPTPSPTSSPTPTGMPEERPWHVYVPRVARP